MYPESSLGCCTPHLSWLGRPLISPQCFTKVYNSVPRSSFSPQCYTKVYKSHKSEPKALRVVQHNHSAPLHQSKPVICVFGRTVSLTHVCRLYKNILCSMMVIQRFALQRLLVAVTTLERDSPISIFIFTIGALSTIGG